MNELVAGKRMNMEQENLHTFTGFKYSWLITLSSKYRWINVVA